MAGGGGGGGLARISEFFFTKNPESIFFKIKNPNLIKENILAGGRGEGGAWLG